MCHPQEVSGPRAHGSTELHFLEADTPAQHSFLITFFQPGHRCRRRRVKCFDSQQSPLLTPSPLVGWGQNATLGATLTALEAAIRLEGVGTKTTFHSSSAIHRSSCFTGKQRKKETEKRFSDEFFFLF